MRLRLSILILLLLFSVTVNGAQEGIDISKELGLENATEIIPDSLKDTDIEFSPSNTPAENGLSINTVMKTFLLYVFDAVGNEISFVFLILGVLVFSAVIFSFIDTSHTALLTAARFAVSAVIAALIIDHIENAFQRASEYISELTTFMTGLLPFLGSLSLAGGEFSTSAVQKAVLLTVINILQSFIGTVALPICKTVVSLSVVGYISGVPLGALSEFITGVATKIITITCGLMCAILYFQNTVSSVTDSLALRSVKLAAGSFIPIIGSFVSEASGTLISGVRLVKSTFGVFAICILVYMSARPIINFLTVKLSVRFSGVVAKLIGCDREAKVFGEISSVYNILSAIMIASACFFIFSIAVFIKSEVR